MNNHPLFKYIESRQNPLFKKVLKLSQNRRRRQSHLIWIEQKRHLDRYIETFLHKHRSEKIEIFFIAQSLYQDQTWRNWVEEKIASHAIEIASIKDTLLSELTFSTNAKIVALAPWKLKKIEELNRAESATYLILDDIEKPGNIGAILRSCDGAGIDAVIAIGKKDHKNPSSLLTSCDLGHPSVVQNAMGALFSLPIASATFEEAVDWLHKEKISLYLASPDAKTDFDQSYDKRSCLLVGREDIGIASHWKEIPSVQSRSIPMRGVCDSLNVATSAALMLYAMQRTRFQK